MEGSNSIATLLGGVRIVFVPLSEGFELHSDLLVSIHPLQFVQVGLSWPTFGNSVRHTRGDERKNVLTKVRTLSVTHSGGDEARVFSSDPNATPYRPPGPIGPTLLGGVRIVFVPLVPLTQLSS